MAVIFGVASSLIGNEILQVQGITSTGLPAASTQQCTALQVATVGSFGAISGPGALTLTTSATLTLVPGLTTSLVAGGKYAFEIYLSTSASAGGGLVVNLGQGTLTAATFTADTWMYNTTTLAAQGATTVLTTSLAAFTGIVTAVSITGTVTATNSGTFAVFCAQNVGGNASSTVINPGSYLALQRLA